MRCACFCALALVLTLHGPAALAQPVFDEPGVVPAAPGHGVSLGDRMRARRGAPPMSPHPANTHGFHAGLGYAGIMACPQLVLWSYPFFRVFEWSVSAGDCSGGDLCDVERFLAGIGGTGSMVIALFTSLGGLAAGVTGTYLVVEHSQSGLKSPRLSSAYDAGLVKGMGIGLLATGTVNVFMAGLFLGAQGEELFTDDEDAGEALLWTMLGVGLAQVVGGGIMALVGHSQASDVLTNVSVAPVALPGGGAVMLGGRF